MQQDELTALIGRTAILMEQFERRCEEIEAHQRTLCEQLQQLSQRAVWAVCQAADESLRDLSGAVTGKVEDGLSQPVAAYEHRLRKAGTLLQEGSQGLAAQIARLQWLHRQLVWKVVAVAFGSLLLLLAGGGWLSSRYRADIERQRVGADLLRAYNRADVSLCDGRLCANVDLKGRAYGEDKQYRPVRPRR